MFAYFSDEEPEARKGNFPPVVVHGISARGRRELRSVLLLSLGLSSFLHRFPF